MHPQSQDTISPDHVGKKVTQDHLHTATKPDLKAALPPSVANLNLCIVGLGYVGLPLAHAFAEKGFTVSGYDISEDRIAGLKRGEDWTEELTKEEMAAVEMSFSSDPAIINAADVIILALPTPIDAQNQPDLRILKSATETAGQHIKKGSIIVYESTVYPGTTEEICGPILEQASGLKCGSDFTLGYSPERINPGSRRGGLNEADTGRTIQKIIKIVAGQDEPTTDLLCELYGSIIDAGIHRAPNIKVAEMGKAIENAQRDLNIAFVNEVAMLCNRIGISTHDVIEAAGTKWNFIKYRPGLVGGHCISVDPYYLVEKARQMNMETHVITAGRHINDSMGAYVASEIANSLPLPHKGRSVLVLGLTFKENVPDTRNSKARDVVQALEGMQIDARVHDVYLSGEEISTMHCTPGSLADGPYDAIALLVPHQEYLDFGTQALVDATKEGGVIYDLKSVLDKDTVEKAGRTYLAL